ncbi:MAG TPA: glycoside hydrolase family 15 protein [Solirubrobacterales bacterium]
MAWSRAALGAGVAVAVAALLVSGGSGTDPQAPRFLEIGVVGSAGATVAVDSFGSVIDRRRARGEALANRRWLGRVRPLGAGAPPWARRMYLQSLLVLRALTDRNGAVIAGAREGWAYVWPRDAGAVALAFAAAGYRAEARRVARFLLGLDLDAAARFYEDGAPVGGREAQGDARGWVEAAARAAGIPSPTAPFDWRDRPDYQEKGEGDYLGNAIASGAPVKEIAERFRGTDGVLVRKVRDPGSGVDSAVAWAVQPFPYPALFPTVRRSLRRLIDERGGRFGIVPSEDWPEDDPWTVPTAWAAWAFASLGDRATALELMSDLRRAATPLGLLPERVDAQTGEPRSTTPLAWSHAFAILALHRLWPGAVTRLPCITCQTRYTTR